MTVKRYFTGEACPYGHVAERLVSTDKCVECSRLYNALPHIRAARKQWARSGTPAAKAMSRHKARKRTARKRGYHPGHNEAHCPPRPADDRCQCCGEKREHKRHPPLILDHNHKTGRFRGWLCVGCNTAVEHKAKQEPYKSYLMRAQVRDIIAASPTLTTQQVTALTEGPPCAMSPLNIEQESTV